MADKKPLEELKEKIVNYIEAQYPVVLSDLLKLFRKENEESDIKEALRQLVKEMKIGGVIDLNDYPKSMVFPKRFSPTTSQGFNEF